MVQKHRAARKATLAKDVSPMRNFDKYALSSSPSDRSGFGLGLGSSKYTMSVPTATVAASVNKWKYNDMVTNNRDQFNGMHWC